MGRERMETGIRDRRESLHGNLGFLGQRQPIQGNAIAVNVIRVPDEVVGIEQARLVPPEPVATATRSSPSGARVDRFPGRARA